MKVENDMESGFRDLWVRRKPSLIEGFQGLGFTAYRNKYDVSGIETYGYSRSRILLQELSGVV